MTEPDQVREYEEEKEENDVYKSGNKRGPPAITEPTYAVDDEVVMKVKIQQKTLFPKFRVAARKETGGKWFYQLKTKDGTPHGDGDGAWCAQAELRYP